MRELSVASASSCPSSGGSSVAREVQAGSAEVPENTGLLLGAVQAALP